MDTEVKLPKPTSGLNLATILELEPTTGVVVAVFPEVIEEVTTMEVPFTDKKDEYMHVVLCKTGAWGVRAMDVQSMEDEPIKWWRAKAIIADAKLDMVPVRWEGPLGAIPQVYFDNDYVLAIRFYDHGPWFFPKEQPKFKTEEAVEKAVNAYVAETANKSVGG